MTGKIHHISDWQIIFSSSWNHELYVDENRQDKLVYTAG